MQRTILTAVFVSALTIALQVIAQDGKVIYAPPEDESSSYKVETVLEGLDNPGGLAIRSGSTKTGPHELFISESGAGRVIRISTDQPQQINEAINGFAQSSFGDNPSYRVGPLGLAFLTRSKLAVGGGGRGEQDTIDVFVLPEDGVPITVEQVHHSVGPIKAENRAQLGAATFFGLARADTALYVAWTEENQGWLLKAGIAANRLAFLQPFVATKETSGAERPAGIAIIPNPRPPFLVVAQMGSFDARRDSLLTFYVPSTGELAMSLGTGLHDIIALAYSPSNQLYALDFAWSESEAGGVYRLDDARLDGRQACRSVKIAAVTRPSALAFTPDGSLYVTAFGEGENDQQGVLLKITGEL